MGENNETHSVNITGHNLIIKDGLIEVAASRSCVVSTESNGYASQSSVRPSHVPSKSGVRLGATNETPRLKLHLHQFCAFYIDHRQGGNAAAGGLGNLARRCDDVTKSNDRQQSPGPKCFCSV